MTNTRRLAAILAADIAGYSAAMERDEEGTAAAVRALRREVIEPKLAEHHGRLIKTTGDGFLVEFASPIAALNCALAIQQRPDSGSLRLRIGLNLGDVIIEESGDVLGEGVNVAARLEGLAEPGGILISGKIFSEVEGKVQAAFEDRGEQQVKNISKPIRAYAVQSDAIPTGRPAYAVSNPLPLPDKPSIAVLPFQNMSGDPEQEYFADGIVEDIITALSRFKSLFVIARNSSFTYKCKTVDIKQVGRELGVRYVLEGSVRKAGTRVRITGQLIDASSGAHLWADKFEGSIDDTFALQDDVTQKVVVAIAPRVEQTEMARARKTAPTNPDAYDYYLRGLGSLYPVSAGSLEQSLQLFSKATDLDPNFSSAYGMRMHCLAATIGIRATDATYVRDEVGRLWQVILRIGQDDALALSQCAFAVANVLRQLAPAKELIEKAVQLNPNLANAWQISGWIRIWQGQPKAALEDLARAERLDPFAVFHLPAKAHALFFLGKYDEALQVADRGLQHHPKAQPVLRIGAASAALAGHIDKARDLSRSFLSLDPGFRLSHLENYLGPYQNSEFVRTYAHGLRLAGLPE